MKEVNDKVDNSQKNIGMIITNKKKMFLIIFFVICIAIIAISSNRFNLYEKISKNILQTEEPEKGFTYKVYDNMDENNIRILITAKDTENGVKEVSYTNNDGEKIAMTAYDNRTQLSLDYSVKRNETYHFEMINNNDETISYDMYVDENFDDFSSRIETLVKAEYDSYIYVTDSLESKISYKLDNMTDYQECSGDGIQLNGNDLNNAGLIDENSNVNISFIREDAGGNKLLIKGKFNINYYYYRDTEFYITGDSLIQAVYDNQLENGNYTFVINGESYPAEVYNYKENLTYSSTSSIGNSTADSRMLIVKCEKDVTINSGVTVTPTTRKKGFFICSVGDMTNNGTITMTARGAIAAGQNVYLWQNESGSYEYVPATGGAGGAGAQTYLKSATIVGANGANGTNRQTGGGSGGTAKKGACCNKSTHTVTAGAGTAGTSYSGGSGRRIDLWICYYIKWIFSKS